MEKNIRTEVASFLSLVGAAILGGLLARVQDDNQYLVIIAIVIHLIVYLLWVDA